MILLNEDLLIGDEEYFIRSNINSLKIYPNPFNKNTTITFSLSEEAFVNIEIFSIQGEIVKTLTLSKKLKPGNYAFSWDGKDNYCNSISKGMYYVQLKTYGKTIGKKIVLK